jgi:hypothetical protein
MTVTAMRITIGLDTLGESTTEDAERYADAVAAAVETEYPAASGDVTIAEVSATPSIDATEWTEYDATVEQLQAIQQRVWERGDRLAQGNS